MEMVWDFFLLYYLMYYLTFTFSLLIDMQSSNFITSHRGMYGNVWHQQAAGHKNYPTLSGFGIRWLVVVVMRMMLMRGGTLNSRSWMHSSILIISVLDMQSVLVFFTVYD